MKLSLGRRVGEDVYRLVVISYYPIVFKYSKFPEAESGLPVTNC